MDGLYIIKPIAHIYTDFPERFGIPRQSGLTRELSARIIFEKEFRDPNALKGIEQFSHLWLIWRFSETAIDMSEDNIRWSALVKPPRLGGKIKEGVFATRSPYRPNSLGLSCVELIRKEIDPENGTTLIVGGADIMNGSEIFDIKPYIPYADCRPEASAGFSVKEDKMLRVQFPKHLLDLIQEEKQAALMSILEQDPRGSYEKLPGYHYGLNFAGYDIRFTVEDEVLTVFDVRRHDDHFKKIK